MKSDWAQSNKQKPTANGFSHIILGQQRNAACYQDPLLAPLRQQSKSQSQKRNVNDDSIHARLFFTCVHYIRLLHLLYLPLQYHSTVNCLSRSENPSKKERNKLIASCTSCDPAVSRMECMESIGQPMSTVRTPILDRAGPTVDPHALHVLLVN